MRKARIPSSLEWRPLPRCRRLSTLVFSSLLPDEGPFPLTRICDGVYTSGSCIHQDLGDKSLGLFVKDLLDKVGVRVPTLSDRLDGKERVS